MSAAARERLETLEIAACDLFIPFRPRRAPRGELGDAALQADIASRGLDNPVRVFRNASLWEVISGDRRVRACLAIDPKFAVLCTIQPSKQNTEVGRALTRLADNAQTLRTWELCEELHRLTQIPLALHPAKIASLTQYSERYVSNLLRLRRQLSPEIWARWAIVGDELPVAVLLEVCALPSMDQPRELAALLSGRRRGRPRSKRMSRRQIERILHELERDQHHAQLWCDGAEHALRAVLGEKRFSEG